MVKTTYRRLIMVFTILGIICHNVDASPPNVIFILADDLGYGDLSSFGSQTIDTPNIDSLAKNGLKLTDYYAASPVCSPSRAAFLTGRYPYRTGFDDVIFNDSMDGLQNSEITIAEQLKKAGYATALIGKWHLGFLDRYMPWNQGFDEFYGLPFSNDMGNLFWYENQDIIYKAIDQHYLTQRYTDKAVDFITRHHDQRFFLYLAHSMPHIPLYASPEFEGKSKAGLYGDVVEELDASTGTIVDTLKKLGILENTLIVFTSDNGPWLMMKDHGGSAGQLRDGKTVTFEGGQRVPAVVQWPAVIEAGKAYHGIVTMMDWFTTLSEMAGIPVPQDRPIDGVNIESILHRQQGDFEREFFYLSTIEPGQVVAYRKGNWKLKLPRSGYPRILDSILKINRYSHSLLLFDLSTDIGEQKDLSKQYPQRVEDMHKRIQEFQQSLEAQPRHNLLRKGTKADHTGFDRPLKSLLIIVIPAVMIVIGMLYGLYRLLKRLIRRRPTRI